MVRKVCTKSLTLRSIVVILVGVSTMSLRKNDRPPPVGQGCLWTVHDVLGLLKLFRLVVRVSADNQGRGSDVVTGLVGDNSQCNVILCACRLRTRV